MDRAGRLLPCWALCVIQCVLCSPHASIADDEFFEKQIRPILVEHCQKCHGDKKHKGGLRLTDRDLALMGGDTGAAILPGKPDESLLIKAIDYTGELKMPPDGKLSEGDIEKLKRWVMLGAPWPAANTPPGESKPAGFQVTPVQQKWWAYQPVRDQAPPAVKDPGWPRNEVDQFILADLETRTLRPSEPADRRTWLRRVTFDLTGLPPTPEDVEVFLADASADACTRVVDRLLASPAYGQRWARHWLDVVRYADFYDANPKTRTASCEITEAWRYRDWVVDSLNGDLPFDQFIMHQIAGDLLPSPTGEEIYPEGLIATTFLTNGAWDRGDADKEKMVSDMVDDNIDTVGKAFLGVTLGCARCHDHKFDPISNEDYYALAGVFYSSHLLKELGAKGGEYTMNRVPLAPKAVVAQRDEQLKRINETNANLADLDKRDPKPPADDPERVKLATQRDKLQSELLPEPPLAIAMQEGGTVGGLFPGIQDVPIHIRGSYTRLGPVVSRRLPRFLAGDAQPAFGNGSGRRELATWIASKSNPLTARVIVNRVWQWHFGEGLVRTPNNFGLLSEPPSHPALLDRLASRLMEEGWSLKKLHRRILLSATYGQGSRRVTPQRESATGTLHSDPDNRWLGRFAARRLEAEAIRDAMLMVAGQLDAGQGGPAGDDLHILRRSLYVQTARWDRGNFATLFDAANPDASVEKRNVSTVAPQSLFLLNDKFVMNQAKHLATRLSRDVPSDDAARIQYAYRLLFSRPATEAEIDICTQILTQPDQAVAWVDLAHVLLCSNEFVYLD